MNAVKTLVKNGLHNYEYNTTDNRLLLNISVGDEFDNQSIKSAIGMLINSDEINDSVSGLIKSPNGVVVEWIKSD